MMTRIVPLMKNTTTRSAFVFWVMAVISANFSIAPAANFLALCGALLLLANIVWASLSPALATRPPVVLLGSAVLQLHLGPTFYHCLVTGLLAVLLAAFLIFFNACYPIQAAEFLGLDPSIIYEECYVSKRKIIFRYMFLLIISFKGAQDALDQIDQEKKERRSSPLTSGIRRTFNRLTYSSADHEMSSLLQQSPIPSQRSTHLSREQV